MSLPLHEQIALELNRAGVRRGAALLVHSSLRALGPVSGGAETVIRGLLAALGPEGTLLMPALSYECVTPEKPLFDALRTPSNIGALAEYFRLRLGTRRSIHPTHSVCALGPLADSLLGRHHLDRSPVGPCSPLALLPGLDGQILFLGCGLRPNTSMHGVEELAPPPYLFGPEINYLCLDRDGREVPMRVRSHDFRGVAQRYDRLAQVLGPEELREGRVLAATVQVMETGPMWRRALDALRRSPLFFVDRI